MQTGSGYRPLSSHDFYFYGFTESDSILDQYVGGVGIRSAEPQVQLIEGGVCIPAVIRSAEGQLEKRPAGILDGDGRRLALGRRASYDSELPSRVSELDEEVVYLGWLINQYGHFLLESLGRVWALNNIDPSVRVVFHASTVAIPKTLPSKKSNWIWETLKAFGIELDRILVLEEPTRFARILVPDPLYEPLSWAFQCAADPFRGVAKKVLDGKLAQMRSEPLFISRSRLASSQRRIVGEYELEIALRRNGFRIVYPEAMSLEEQIITINQHSDIFAGDGTAAHNVLFALCSPRLHLLSDSRPRLDHFLVPFVAGTQTSFIRCLGSGERAFPQGTGRLFPQLLEPDVMTSYLVEQGFVKAAPQGRVQIKPEALRRDFDEAWVYARIRQTTKMLGKVPTDPEGQNALQDWEQHEALQIARSSWPVSLALARYYVGIEPSRVDELSNQYVALVSTESDRMRLAHFRADATRHALDVARACSPATAENVIAATAAQFNPERSVNQMPDSLDAMGLTFGTDKASSRHDYLRHYEGLFAPLRDTAFDMLEIGVAKGASARLWHEYFPTARIVGADIRKENPCADIPRFVFERGSQADPAFINGLVRKYNFRIVIDDGSHLWGHQIFTFQSVFPWLVEDCIYICEDIHTSFGDDYREKFSGGATVSAAGYFLNLAEKLAAGNKLGLRQSEDPLLHFIIAKTRSITFIRHAVIVLS